MNNKYMNFCTQGRLGNTVGDYGIDSFDMMI